MNKGNGGYAFISHYLWLLALPMFIGLGGVVIQFQLVYRDAVEQSLSTLNHAIALSEADTFDSIEHIMALSVTSERYGTLAKFKSSQDYYRNLWDEQTRLNSLLGAFFFADSNGWWFSNSTTLDKMFSDISDPSKRLDPRDRPWFKNAVLKPNALIWNLPYKDAFSQENVMTLSYSIVDAKNSEITRVLGIDINLTEWSKKLSALIMGGNGVRHLLLDRASGQILLHSNQSRIGLELIQPWRFQLTGESGSFFVRETQSEENSQVVYETIRGRSQWVAVTVQPWRNTLTEQQLLLVMIIIGLSVGLFVVLAVVFRQRLAGVIDRLVLMVRQLRRPEGEPLILPSTFGFAELNIEMDLVSSHLQENVERANRDGLTSLYNRRYLDDKLAQLQAQQTTIVLAMIDIDNFKSINDRFGHAFGDTVLRRIAALGLASLSNSTVLCRYGGEELVAIFEQDSLEEAVLQLERWRLDVAKANWREEDLTVTFSAGIGASEGLTTIEMLFEAVDQALYRAKKDGKNRCYRAA